MSYSQKQWVRPKTSRVYLHPPLAERLVLMWPEFKITNTRLMDNGLHVGHPGMGFILMHGENMEAFDYRKTSFSPVQAGYPFYTVNYEDEYAVSLEAFCDFQRNPITYFRVTLKNANAYPVSDCIGQMCRSGSESYMVQQHQEGYAPYKPNLKNWYMLKRTWKQIGETAAGDAEDTLLLKMPKELSMRWINEGSQGHKFEASDYFRVDFTLEPGQELSWTGAFRAMPYADSIDPDFEYDREKENAVRLWKEMLADLQVVPDTENPVYQDVYRHLAMQLCQMQARYEGSDLIATRQGDLGRYVWPYEASLILTTMDIIGLRKYTGEGYRYFCERWLVKEGPDEGRIQSDCAAWENFTGMILWGVSEHLKLAGNSQEYDYFVPKLQCMLGWIQRHRSENYGGYEGIFPVGRGSDWADQAQFWTFTDSYNVRGIRSMAEMLEQYGQDASEVWAIHDEYRDRLIEIRDALYQGHEDDEEYLFPHELGLSFEDTELYSYYTDGAPVLLRTGFIDANSKMRVQMENYFRNHGQFERGLTGLMTSCESMWDSAYHGGYGDVWYTIQSELYWVPAWMEAGEVEKAKETVEALLKYGITKEYIASERYCSIDEWYAPWQPNGSGSASMMQILLSYFGEKRK